MSHRMRTPTNGFGRRLGNHRREQTIKLVLSLALLFATGLIVAGLIVLSKLPPGPGAAPHQVATHWCRAKGYDGYLTHGDDQYCIAFRDDQLVGVKMEVLADGYRANE